MKQFKSGLPLTEAERARERPTLEGAFAYFESGIAHRRRRQGFRQSYRSPGTPATRAAIQRMMGEKDE